MERRRKNVHGQIHIYHFLQVSSINVGPVGFFIYPLPGDLLNAPKMPDTLV